VAVALAVALVLPLAALPLARSLPVWGDARETWTGFLGRFTGQGTSDHPSLDLGLQLDQGLRQRSSTVMLRTRVQPGPDGTIASDGAERLRVATLYHFDGEDWSQGASSLWTPLSGDGYAWPEGLQTWAMEAEPVVVEVEIRAFDQSLVPVTTGPRVLVGLDGAEYDPMTDSVRHTPNLATGAVYTVETYHASADVLPGLTAPAGGPFSPEETLALPDRPSVQALTDQARRLTEGIEGAYAQLQAIEAWLRSAEFTYTLNIPESATGDPVGDFLERKSGYCVHFASAFALMARSLGYPTRVAIGFTAGTATKNEGEREIRGSNSHSWPEVYFEGAGWVPFEPTPSPSSAASASSAPPPSASAAPGGGGAGAGNGAGWLRDNGPRLVVVLVGLLTAGAVVAERRHRRAHATAEEVWAALAEKAQLTGVSLAGDTVRATAEKLAGRIGDERAAAAAVALGQLIEARRYAPPGGDGDDDGRARSYRDLIEAAKPFAPAARAATDPDTTM
jgi:transglutaminase-like putative cysteine protease